MSDSPECRQNNSELLLPGDPGFEEHLSGISGAFGALLGNSITIEMLFGNLDEEKQPIFDLQEEEDIFEATRTAVEYAEENDVSAVVFIDKSARPMWVAFKEYWQGTHPQEEPAPNIFFIEPDGFKAKRWERKSSKKDKMEIDHPHLNQHRDGTVLVIDTCIHTGKTAGKVLDFMKDCDFEDVRFAVVTDRRNYSSIEPDIALLDRLPRNRCYPFGRVGHVTEPGHTRTHLYAERWSKEERSPERIKKVRDEIRQVIRDHLTQDRPD